MTEGRNDGFFVTYNHPVWSLEAGGEYMGYHGMHAMEIANYSSFILGCDERNNNIYGNMLRGTRGLYCIAADDNHDTYPAGEPENDSFGCFTMIKAEKLEYGAITQAMLDGSFYASEGPMIKELYFEDGYVHIKTSDAVWINMITDGRFNRRIMSEDKVLINSASFKIEKNAVEYFRFVIRDSRGNEAYTNAYYVDTLPLED